MAGAYEWADLVICRAGALTVAELAAAAWPACWCRFRMRSTTTRRSTPASCRRPAPPCCCRRRTDPGSDQRAATKYAPAQLQEMAEKARQLAKPEATAELPGCARSLPSETQSQEHSFRRHRRRRHERHRRSAGQSRLCGQRLRSGRKLDDPAAGRDSACAPCLATPPRTSTRRRGGDLVGGQGGQPGSHRRARARCRSCRARRCWPS
jgi:hypothetical protein